MAIFARSSSGLRREFALIDVFIFNVLAYAIGVSVAITPGLLATNYPEANFLVVMAIGVLLSACNGYAYGLFAAAMPRSGGDYIFISRTLDPSVGFTASWGFTISQVLGIGLYAGQCVKDSLAPSMIVFGNVTNQPAWIEIGKKLQNPIFVGTIGILLLLSVLLISVSGLRLLKRFLKTLFWLALAGTLVMAYLLWTATPNDFIREFNDFMAKNNLPNAYSSIKDMAIAIGQPKLYTTWTVWESLMALPIGYLVFVGFNYSVYVGGEVQGPDRSQRNGILGALFFGAVIYVMIVGSYYGLVKQEFVNALGILDLQQKNPIPAGGSLLLFASLLTKNIWLQALMCMSSFLWFYLLLFVMTQVCVRNIFAWAMDKLFPYWCTTVSERTGSPWASSIIVISLAIAWLIVGLVWEIGFINYIALFSVNFLLAGIAAMVFPYQRPDLLTLSPTIVKQKFRGIYVMVWMGIGTTALFVIILFSALFHPTLSGTSGFVSKSFLLLVYGSGYIWYLFWSTDRSFIHDNLPPE